MAMEYTEEQLNNFDKSTLIQLFLVQQSQLKDIDAKLQLLLEQVAVLNNNRYGRSSEKLDTENQICFMEVDGNIVYFNEAEAVDALAESEADDEKTQKPRSTKTKGRRAADIRNLPVVPVEHMLSEEELTAEFGKDGWYQLEDEIFRRYRFTPMKVEIEEHHVGVYKSKKDNHFKKAEHPGYLLRNSLVSPSLEAGIINAKYVNAVPLYRLEKEFERYGLAITRQNMANWMIRLAENYLGVMYDYLHSLLYDYHVIQADETPVLVNKDGRPAGSKSWMWVYRSGFMNPEKQIILYEYQKTRNASHPRKFLKDYTGICVTDGYQVYHTLEKEKEDLRIAGCWVHCRRKFHEALEVMPKELRKQSVMHLIMNQIQAIYREEGKLSGLSAEERLAQRQLVVKPLVDAFFAYLKQNAERVPKSGKTKEAFTYALNQERYLRVFLEDGDVPMDNNASERAIRGFCIGKKNWEMIDTLHGASSSAIIYSIAETAKANRLKPYEYFEFLLTEIPKHMEDKNTDFLSDLLPWSDALPENIRKLKSQDNK